MLKPAMQYVEELKEEFSKVLYGYEYFLFTGDLEIKMPNLDFEGNYFKYAVVSSDNKVYGYISYCVKPYTKSIECLQVYSFYNNPIVMTDLLRLFKDLLTIYNRIEWFCIGTNPIKEKYDSICKKFDGQILKLNKNVLDMYGEIVDSYIYEIIKKE